MPRSRRYYDDRHESVFEPVSCAKKKIHLRQNAAVNKLPT